MEADQSSHVEEHLQKPSQLALWFEMMLMLDPCEGSLPTLASADSDQDSISTQESVGPMCGVLPRKRRRRKKRSRRRVHFDTIRIREYRIIVGDHPFCRDDLPLSLDWQHSEERVYDVDEYEDIQEQMGRRELGKVRRLNFWRRRQLLHAVGGYSDGDFEEKHMRRPSALGVELFLDKFEDEDWDLAEGENISVGFPASMLEVEVLED